MIQAFVTGNLGKDAETREAGNDTVTSFSVASNRKVKSENVTTWVRCSLWGKRGESLRQYLTKGTKVAVSGELSTREHDGKTYLEIRVNEVDLMGGGERRDSDSGSQQTRNKPKSQAADDGYKPESDDIPF